MPDMYNQCEFAHGSEELDEWRERWHWRRMKREMAEKEHAHSYMDELLKAYREAEHPLSVVSKLGKLIGVK